MQNSILVCYISLICEYVSLIKVKHHVVFDSKSVNFWLGFDWFGAAY